MESLSINVPNVGGSTAVGMAAAILMNHWWADLALSNGELGIVGAGFGAAIAFLVGFIPRKTPTENE